MATRIDDVAKYQRWLLLAILAQLILMGAFIYFNIAAGATPGQPATPPPAGLAVVLALDLVAGVIAITTLVLLVLLMVALGRPVISIVLAALAMFLPIISLIVLLVVNQRATSTLRAAGYHVGLLGAAIGPGRTAGPFSTRC